MRRKHQSTNDHQDGHHEPDVKVFFHNPKILPKTVTLNMAEFHQVKTIFRTSGKWPRQTRTSAAADFRR